MIDLSDTGVEPSNTAEAGGQRNITHSQVCLVTQLLRKVHLARLGHSAWGRAQVLKKQAAEVSRADSEAFREGFDSTVFQAAFTYQAQGSRNCIWRSEPRRCSGRAFGAATQARAETRFRSCCSCWKVTNVLLFRRRCWTDRPAIHTAREHGNEELAVEAHIARHPSSRTDLPIQFHMKLMITRLRPRLRRFRTTL
jgi:hypothetical protein